MLNKIGTKLNKNNEFSRDGK